MIYALFVGGSAFLIALVIGAFIVPALHRRRLGKVDVHDLRLSQLEDWEKFRHSRKLPHNPSGG